VVHDETALAPNDRIRFVVTSDRARFLMIASVDGAGNASIYFPYHGARSGPVAGERVELPGSIILDDAPGPERLFAVFSDEPISADVVRRALEEIRGAGAIRSTSRLSVDAQDQLSLVFEKVTP
jgi:hypothetical protein